MASISRRTTLAVQYIGHPKYVGGSIWPNPITTVRLPFGLSFFCSPFNEQYFLVGPAFKVALELAEEKNATVNDWCGFSSI